MNMFVTVSEAKTVLELAQNHKERNVIIFASVVCLSCVTIPVDSAIAVNRCVCALTLMIARLHPLIGGLEFWLY